MFHVHSGSRVRALTRFGAAALAAATLAACGTSSGTSTSGSSGSATGPTPGYDAKTNTFNVVGIQPLSGPLAPVGSANAAGQKIFFDALNATGGIDGKYKVNYTVEDSQYNAQVAVPLYSRVKGNNALISGLFGTAILNSLKPQLVTDKVAALADASSAVLAHDPNLLPFGASGQTNMINLVDYAANKLGHKTDTFCSVTQADDLGSDNRQGIQFAVKEIGLKFGIDAPVRQTDKDFTPQVQQLKKAGCQVVLLGATTSQVPGLMSASIQLSFAAQWLGQNNTYDPALVGLPVDSYLQQHFQFAMIGVNWDSSVPGMVAMRQAFDKYGAKDGAKQSPYTELGYAHGMLVQAVLSQAIKANNFTREGILDASRQVGDFDYGGLLPTWKYVAPADRVPPYTTSIFGFDPKKTMGVALVQADYTSDAAKKFASQ